MRELVVVSGKGGTGKTSVSASFSALARGQVVIADCDVDAADLHLVLCPTVERTEPFIGGSTAFVDPSRCNGCAKCAELCRFEAIVREEEPDGASPRAVYRVDPVSCEGCGVCAWFCPEQAIVLRPAVRGQWFVSATDYGPLLHARMGLGAENSGKLVSLLRRTAAQIAREREIPLILVDGPPGIGCPVISSITGSSLVLAVTEPTVSGEHDLERILELTRHFGIPSVVCVNKWDLNPELTARMEQRASGLGASILQRIRFDPAVTAAQVHGKPIVEWSAGPAATDIRAGWEQLSRRLQDSKPGESA